ncbi:MAG: cytochrome c3 family protein [Bdellovibrionales bacterium]|nr:cytochrome c3 family protein [Bdellovibrionales bacterium]
MIFNRSILFGALGIGAVLLVFGAAKEARQMGNTQGYEPDQPINFSHKVHAGENKISCRYCHYGAERGRHAGIPPTQLCLNCHSEIKKDSPEIAKIKEALDNKDPIEWIRIHQLPDFSYFNHSQHVTAGVSCQQCHGPVESMTRMRQHAPLTMGWCLECHRAQGLAPPHDQRTMAGGDCNKCHY